MRAIASGFSTLYTRMRTYRQNRRVYPHRPEVVGNEIRVEKVKKTTAKLLTDLKLMSRTPADIDFIRRLTEYVKENPVAMIPDAFNRNILHYLADNPYSPHPELVEAQKELVKVVGKYATEENFYLKDDDSKLTPIELAEKSENLAIKEALTDLLVSKIDRSRLYASLDNNVNLF